MLGNGFASFVDLYAVRQAEKEPFFDYVKCFEDRHRHYCEVKGDWTVTLHFNVMIHTAVSGLNSELKTLYFNTLPPINSWHDFKQWGQQVDIILTEKRDYQKVSARRIAAVDGATHNTPIPIQISQLLLPCLLPHVTHRMATPLREDHALHAKRMGTGLKNVLIRRPGGVTSMIQTVDRALTEMLSLWSICCYER